MSLHTPPGFEPIEPAPVSPIETIFWRLEDAFVGSYRVTALCRLEGLVEPGILAEALRRLQNRHPKLRASIGQRSDGRLWYRFQHTSTPIPFEILDYDNADFPWREETRRLLQLPFPTEGPLVAITVLRCPARKCSQLLLTVHHAIADGLSAIMLVDGLLTEYAIAEADTNAPLDPPLPPVVAMRARTTGGLLSRLWLLRRFIRLQTKERHSRQTSLPQASNVPPQSQWELWVFSPEETLRLVRRCRKEQTSLGGALVAAACCGLIDCLPVSQAMFKCQFPFDLREVLKGSSGPVTARDLGCFASVMNEFYDVPQQPSFWDLARQAHRNIQAFVRHGGPSFNYNIASATSRKNLVARAAPKVLTSTDERVTLLATNYGVVSMRDRYGSLCPRDCTLTFKNDVVGPSLVMEALVLGQRLNIGLAADGLDPAFWAQLHLAVRRRLAAAAGTVQETEAPQRMSVAPQE